MSSLSTDLTKLVSDSSLVLIGRIGTVAFSFIVHLLIVRNLEPEMFGTLSLALTLISVCAGFAAIGMGQAIARFVSISDAADTNEYVVVALSTVFITGPIFTALLYLFSGTVEAYFGSAGLANLLKLLSILITVRILSKVIHGIVRGYELTKMKIINFDVLPFIISTPILYYFILQENVLIGAVVYYLIQPIIKILLLSVNLRQWDGTSFGVSMPSREKISTIFSFSWPLSFESLVVIFFGSVDILMLSRLASSTMVGQYRSVQPVANTLIIFLQVLTFIYLPIASRYFSQQNYTDLDTIYKTSTRWIAHLTFPLFIFYLLFGKELIQVAFGDEYTVAWIVLAILAVGMYSRVVIGPNGMTIQAIDRTQEDLLASFGGLLVNVVLNYTLIPRYGIAGAAVATTAGYFVYNSIELLIIHKYTSISPFHIDLFTPFVPTILFWIGLVYVFSPTPNSLIELFGLGVTIAIIHTASLLFTTGLTQEDRMLVNNLKSYVSE